MSIDEKISTVNELFNKGNETKDIARKSDENIDLYNEAAEQYLQSANLLEEIVNELDATKINGLTRAKVLKEYYLFESFECKYSYEYKNGHYNTAVEKAKEAQKHILSALQIIDENFLKLNSDTQSFLTEMKSNWTLCKLTIPLKTIEPVAKNAMNLKDYVTAMDSYRRMNQLQDLVFKYVNESTTLPEAHKRIERGNYYSSKASIANTIAGIYTLKGGDNDKEILEQFLISLENIKKAQDINPEWDKFKEGTDITRNNIKRILQNNQDDWDKFYYNFESNEQLKIIMKEINVRKFNEIELKRKLNEPENKTNKLFIYGSFWTSVFLILLMSVTTLFLLKIHWTIVILIILLVQLVYALISATVLRNLGDISEKRLVDIYKFTIKLNFNLFKKTNQSRDKVD
jgi:hypothetical protein